MKYRTIVVDPPWRYRKTPNVTVHGRRWAEDVYPTMAIEEIATLPIRELADADAHLYLWVTNPRLEGERNDIGGLTPFDLIRGWGFVYKTCLTWCKNQIGLGSYFRGATEHVLFAVKGDLRIPPERRESNVIHAARHGHSQKPEAFFDLVERVSPGPYLELFARRNRLGWDTWGNEALEHIALSIEGEVM